jgi:hypothetical protein
MIPFSNGFPFSGIKGQSLSLLILGFICLRKVKSFIVHRGERCQIPIRFLQVSYHHHADSFIMAFDHFGKSKNGLKMIFFHINIFFFYLIATLISFVSE